MKDQPVPSPAERRRTWLERVDTALRSQGLDAAGALACQALADGVDDPAILNLAASAHYGEGRFEEAVGLLRRAQAADPDNPHIANSLGVCLQAIAQPLEALDAYGAAVRADPGLAAAHFNRGTLLEELQELNAARAAFEQAAALDPQYAEPIASLAWLDAQAGNVASARVQGERALATAPANILARLALASTDLQQGDRSSATARLTALGQDTALTPLNRSIVLGLTGDLLDAEGYPAEAFAAYSAGNALLGTLYAARFEGPGRESALERARRLDVWFAGADPRPWRQVPAHAVQSGGAAAHVFLVGFPRSGTTLLENILAAHPDVVSLEEKDALERVALDLVGSDGGLERLGDLGADEAERRREAYWARVRSFGVEPRGRTFIDKFPLSSVLLPVVAKLFPNARILFAVRDPRDVVLSCFRRRFGMNQAMYQLLTLEGAAAYYDAVMRLSQRYRQLLPLPQHIVRHESLVEDFEGVARSACAFLGIEWRPEMADFAARAGSRGITTPSAAQVAKGLNRDGQGVWRRYEAQMVPVLPLLEPWVREFGYELGEG